MFYILGRPKNVNDLNGYYDYKIGDLRLKTKICIIDDEVFPKKNYLSSHDFKVKEIGDITDINAVEAYQIILCDIKGVGSHFGSKYEGGHIIEEINKYYPNKVIIAYTGERFDPTYNKFFRIADQSIKKDAEGDQWLDVLDEMIKLVHSPIEQWRKTRNRLLELNISSVNLIKIEDLYVRSCLAKSDVLSENKIMNELKKDVKTIVLNLISTVIMSI